MGAGCIRSRAEKRPQARQAKTYSRFSGGPCYDGQSSLGSGVAAVERFNIHFTLEQANALVPWVRSVFDQAHRMLQDVALGIARQTELSLRGSVNGNSRHKPAHLPSEEAERRRQEKLAQINELLRMLMQKGIIIQDVERGLIDFPAWRGGVEILLCYEMTDGGQIGFWHALDAGYAGRQPIADF